MPRVVLLGGAAPFQIVEYANVTPIQVDQIVALADEIGSSVSEGLSKQIDGSAAQPNEKPSEL